MSNNDLVRVAFGRAAKPNDQIVYKDLNAQAANIIGTAFKGPAFVPQILWNRAILNDVPVRNTLIKVLGTHRQNFRAHIYDDYLCYADSEAYDAASTWFAGGGEYAYFTRVLGIGNGRKSDVTGKMVGSGFNLSKNISSGTLDNRIGRNINSLESNNPGSVGFVVRKINEQGSSAQRPENSIPTDNLDYFSELGVPENAFILTDVYMFAQGIVPQMGVVNGDLTSPRDYDTSVVNFNAESLITFSFHRTDRFKHLKLNNFEPYQITLSENSPDVELKPAKIFNISNSANNGNNIKPIENPYTTTSPNQFFNNFLDRGHALYTRFPACELTKNETTVAVLNTNQYPQEEVNYPDYNSFECEYQTAKTPWVTSQPINREGFGAVGTDDNRGSIHERVKDLFRFWSLDDGEIGNRFRIKINIKERGDTGYEKPNKVDPDYSTIAADSDFYVKFDVYIFEYDPRINAYINLELPDEEHGEVEVYENLNLNPHSENYIARVIGTKHTYYDFSSDMIKTEGQYENRSNYVRVEMHEDIEAKKYDTETGPIQHMLLPSGFRSYPHIELNKDAFSSYYNTADTAISVNELNQIFVQDKVYHLPPQYALHYYKDGALPESTQISNSWGVIFTPATVTNSGNKFFLDRLIDEDRRVGNNSEDHIFPLSPHFYYSKYFLSGIEGDNNYRNVWVEEDNYLNSFFHLEKIVYKSTVDENGNLNSSFIDDDRKNMSYKHSGRELTNSNNYKYVDLSADNAQIWEQDSRQLSDRFSNKLSFDFFTYGGFDGVDLRDNDKRLLRNDAIIRELAGEEEGSETNGATYNSYKKAIDIATDDAYAVSDVLVVPGIREIPLIRQCVSACEDSQTQDMFFIGDVSGACSSIDVTFANQTEILVPDSDGDDTVDSNVYSNKPIKVSKGIMGNHVVLDSILNNSYTRDLSKTRADNRFILTDENVPLTGDIEAFYSYKSVVKNQFDNIISLWPTFYIQSRYFLPVMGDVIVSNDESQLNKKIGPETVTLGLIAKNGLRDSLVNSTTPSFLESFNASMTLVDDKNLLAKNENFEINSKKAKEAGINLLYKNTENSTIKLLSQNTAYEERGSIFKDQGVVRTIQQIKKRIMFDLFLNQQLVEGGFFFGQNSNLTNMYQKLDIQLNNILNTFVEEGLITDFKVRVPQSDDDKTILDMQNYIIRGNIILQMNLSDTIDITLDEILQDLSLTADPVNGAVLVPNIP